MNYRLGVLCTALMIHAGCDAGDDGSTGDPPAADTEGDESSDSDPTTDGSGGATTEATTTSSSNSTTSTTDGPDSGDGSTSEGNETSETGETEGNTGDPGSFDEIFETVLSAAGCTAGYCHGAGQGDLTMMDADGAYAALVDVTASIAACDLDTLVVPGDPGASILFARVDPVGSETVDCFSTMPKDGEPLGAEDVELVRSWIEAGAPR